MSDRFDELSRTVSGSMPRRGVLKAVGGAVVGAVAATVFGPFRASGVTGEGCQPGLTPCGAGCCPAGLICADPATARCGCDPSIKTFCGQGCCNKKDTCSDPTTVTCCCKGDTPCGTSCCHGGVACIDKKRGLCGCPAGSTPCGSGATLRCCPAGQRCNSESSSCVNATTGPGQGPGYATPCLSSGCPKTCSCYTQCPPGFKCSNLVPSGCSGPACVPCYSPCGSGGDCGGGSAFCADGCCHFPSL
jgi:hypothetical protein